MATTTHGFPYPIASDAPAGHTQMQSLATAADSAQVATLGAYRTVHEVTYTFTNGNAAGTYVATSGGGAALLGVSNTAFRLCPIILTDYAVANYSTKFRLQAGMITNNTAPGVNFTAAIANISAVAGASGNINITTLGTLLGGVTRSAPGANLGLMNTGTDFDIAGDNLCACAVTLSGTPAANSVVCVAVRLQVRNV